MAQAMTLFAQSQQQPVGGQGSNPFRLAPPGPFDGTDTPDKREKATTFIHQCEMHFETAPAVYSLDRIKIIFASTHLQGRAALWARSYTTPEAAQQCTWDVFRTLFLTSFGLASREYLAEGELLGLRQGNTSVGEYTARFNSLVGLMPGWNNAALRGVFRHGLRSDVELSVRAHDGYTEMSLLDIQNLAARYDRPAIPTERPRRETSRAPTFQPAEMAAPFSFAPGPPPVSSSLPPPPVDQGGPMDLSAARQPNPAAPCFRCHQMGHFANQCPNPRAPPESAPAWIKAAKQRHSMQVAGATLQPSSSAASAGAAYDLSAYDDIPLWTPN